MPIWQSAFQIGWHAQDLFGKKTSQILPPTIKTKASRNYHSRCTFEYSTAANGRDSSWLPVLQAGF